MDCQPAIVTCLKTSQKTWQNAMKKPKTEKRPNLVSTGNPA